MKKNLMSVVILAFMMANLILTIVLMFAIVPETKKVNKMIDDICAAIDLELTNEANGSTVPIEQIEEYNLNGGETLAAINLKSEDGKNHYAVVAVSLSLDTKSDGYKEMGTEGLSARESIIRDTINKIIAQYTIDEFNDDVAGVQNEILIELQNTFGRDFIIGVNFSSVTTE